MLNKFLSPKDGNFIMVKNVIQDMAIASANIMTSRKVGKDSHRTDK
jgi:hypothetical protein